jgi:hypothetical protein
MGHVDDRSGISMVFYIGIVIAALSKPVTLRHGRVLSESRASLCAGYMGGGDAEVEVCRREKILTSAWPGPSGLSLKDNFFD